MLATFRLYYKSKFHVTDHILQWFEKLESEGIKNRLSHYYKEKYLNKLIKFQICKYVIFCTFCWHWVIGSFAWAFLPLIGIYTKHILKNVVSFNIKIKPLLFLLKNWINNELNARDNFYSTQTFKSFNAHMRKFGRKNVFLKKTEKNRLKNGFFLK